MSKRKPTRNKTYRQKNADFLVKRKFVITLLFVFVALSTFFPDGNMPENAILKVLQAVAVALSAYNSVDFTRLLVLRARAYEE